MQSLHVASSGEMSPKCINHRMGLMSYFFDFLAILHPQLGFFLTLLLDIWVSNILCISAHYLRFPLHITSLEKFISSKIENNFEVKILRGTYKKLGAHLGVSFDKVRQIYTKQGTEYAKKYLEDVISEVIPPNFQELVKNSPGDAWAFSCRAVWKALIEVMREKAANGELKVENDRFNISYDEIKARIRPEDKAVVIKELQDALERAAV